jgi:hypothetical protein
MTEASARNALPEHTGPVACPCDGTGPCRCVDQRCSCHDPRWTPVRLVSVDLLGYCSDRATVQAVLRRRRRAERQERTERRQMHQAYRQRQVARRRRQR